MDEVASVSGGALSIRAAAGQTYGKFWQNVNTAGAANQTYELTVTARNTSGATRAFTLLARDSAWTPQNLYSCPFNVPPTPQMQTYRVRFRLSAAINPIVVSGWIEGTASTMLVDNVSLRLHPGLSVTTTECAVLPPANTNLLQNGTFNTNTASWAQWNSHWRVTGGVLEVGRNQGTNDGGFYQTAPYSVPAGGVLEFSYLVGNSSASPRAVTINLHNADWTQQRACLLTLPANTPLPTDPYILRMRTTSAWTDIAVSVWLGDTDAAAAYPYRFDNLDLRYLPDYALSDSVECTPGTSGGVGLMAAGGEETITTGIENINATLAAGGQPTIGPSPTPVGFTGTPRPPVTALPTVGPSPTRTPRR